MAELDQDARRREIAHIAMDLIAREGLEAATVRRIAAEVGFSTTIVTHYFADKQELLLWAYRAVDEWARERFDEAMASEPVDLAAYLLSMCAVRDADRVNWRPLLGIWDRALRDPAFAAFARKLTVTAPPEIDRLYPQLRPARVTVTTARGTFTRQADEALGSRIVPFDDAGLKAKFSDAMAESADARTFALITGANPTRQPGFREVAQRASKAETLAAFLAEYRKRYPETAVPDRGRPAGPGDEGAQSRAEAQAGTPPG